METVITSPERRQTRRSDLKLHALRDGLLRCCRSVVESSAVVRAAGDRLECKRQRVCSRGCRRIITAKAVVNSIIGGQQTAEMRLSTSKYYPLFDSCRMRAFCLTLLSLPIFYVPDHSLSRRVRFQFRNISLSAGDGVPTPRGQEVDTCGFDPLDSRFPWESTAKIGELRLAGGTAVLLIFRRGGPMCPPISPPSSLKLYSYCYTGGSISAGAT